jgi:hypothetical protein
MISETRCRAIVKGRCEDYDGHLQCEVRINGVCLGTGTNYQHRKNRSQCSKAERWMPSNGLYVCGSGTTGCHGYIHAHPTESYEWGWSVKQANDPRLVPVLALLHHPQSIVLHDDGGWHPIDRNERIRAGLMAPFGYLNSEDMGGVA